MSIVDTDVWTCPVQDCGVTVRGTRKHRSHHQGVHARRHGTGRLPSAPPPPEPVIPPAPPERKRIR